MTEPSRSLETFENTAPARDYTIQMTIPEFSCLCPKTGQPDFATLKLEYVPDGRCVELKSLKLYIVSFRNRGTFHEAVFTPRWWLNPASLAGPRPPLLACPDTLR